MNFLSDYELRREANIKERQELERRLFANYWNEEGPSISRQIIEEKENISVPEELGEDKGNSDNEMVEMIEVNSIVQDLEESGQEEESQEELDQEEFDQEEFDQEEFDREEFDREEFDQEEFDQEEFDQEEPSHSADEQIRNWRMFCKDEIFQNIHQIEEGPVQENIRSKRGRYKSTTVDLDRTLESSCTRRFIEWRRTMADGLSNEAIDELLDILHSPDCDIDFLPHNYYHLEQLQDRALMSFKPKTTRWRIPKRNNNIESEEIIVTDIEHLLRLQLQDPEVAHSIITDYSYNNGFIGHPSNGELWKELAAHDVARDLHPLCLKVFILCHYYFYLSINIVGFYSKIFRTNNSFILMTIKPSIIKRNRTLGCISHLQTFRLKWKGK